MIYFSNADGTITKIVNEPVYRGSNSANEIVLIAPFANTNLVTYAYTLPNGISSSENLVMSEGEALGNIVDVEGNQYSMWRAYVDSIMTSQSGDVSIQFFVYSGDSTISTMQTIFSVGVGQRTPLSQEPSPNIYQQILDYLARIDTNLTVDNQLSDTSESPVQNKIITQAIDSINGKINLLEENVDNLSVGLNEKQNKLTAGAYVKIENDTISVTVDLSQFKTYENGAIRIGTPDPLDNVAPNSTAIGNVTKATQEYATAICQKALAYAIKGTAIGYDARVMPNSDFGTSIGSGSRCYSRGGTTVGVNASTGESGGIPSTNSYATAIGANAIATKNKGGAYGAWAKSTAISADAFGADAIVTSPKTIQLGSAELSALNCSVNLTITSDGRDKTDIADIDKALEFIDKLTPVTYVSNRRVDYIHEENKHSEYDENGNEIPNAEFEKYKQYGMADYDVEAYKRGDKKGTRRRSGLIAQDVLQAIKEVYGSDNYANIVDDNFYDLENKPNDVENKLTLAYSNLIPFLIGAIKELKLKVEELEKKIK